MNHQSIIWKTVHILPCMQSMLQYGSYISSYSFQISQVNHIIILFLTVLLFSLVQGPLKITKGLQFFFLLKSNAHSKLSSSRGFFLVPLNFIVDFSSDCFIANVIQLPSFNGYIVKVASKNNCLKQKQLHCKGVDFLHCQLIRIQQNFCIRIMRCILFFNFFVFSNLVQAVSYLFMVIKISCFN